MADRDWTKPRVVNEPQPGFYKLRLVAKGWKVPASLERYDGRWTGLLDGKEIGWWTLDEFKALPDTTDAMRVHLYGEQIDRAEWDYLNALREFCRLHKPDHPCCHPGRPIDIRLQPVEEF